MEERKQKEIEYYNREGERFLEEEMKESGSRAEFSPFLLESYKFLRTLLKKRGQGKRILDYGCGRGIHLIWLAKIGKEVIGIDLSRNSLELTEKRIKKERLENKAKVLLMDCEKMEFPDASFDIIFDGGTFSSLDLSKILPELARVLRSNGFLIGIETLGHNPFLNLKRRINVLFDKRTKWAAEHIFQLKDLKEAEKYFNKAEVKYFHLISWIIFPVLGLAGAKILAGLFEFLDQILLKIPFLRKYAFKIVFIFSEPKTLKKSG